MNREGRCYRRRTLAASFLRLTSAIRLLIVTAGIQVMHATQELGPNSSTKSRASPVHETGGHSRNGSVTDECLFYKVAKKKKFERFGLLVCARATELAVPFVFRLWPLSCVA